MRVLRLRWLTSIVFSLAIIASAVITPFANASATAAVQSNPSSEVNRTLAEMSRAERAEDWHLLYDLMLPDARMQISRTAFVNWWPTVAPAAPADVLKIGTLDFADMTYDLTGDDYENVATVTYAYHDAEGNQVEREVQLAEIGGVWRWMPQVNAAEVGEINSHAGYTVNFTSAFSTQTYQQLDTFWAQIFSDWGKEYRSPVDMVGVRVEGTETGCGTLEDIQTTLFAMYCTRDETIYYLPAARDGIIERYGQAAWDMVMAHEWAHHIQNISGMYVTKSPELFGGNYSIEHELQADCLSAVWMQDATVVGIFDSQAIAELDAMIDSFGDSRGTSWDDVRAHGTGDQRRESFGTGFNDGLRGCHLRAS